ncbi:hypothetical protein C8R46DRAFT_1208777 [Mycena filopes]|nr:hypothetical protein C8R46DRAFT_1208777 [Mycena filopes]
MSLPDEIISEILSPALKVSDEVFSNTSDVSPFATYSEPTSAYLLVCKSWLRVATPLLYNVVILRSKAQAKALALVLAQNKVLGQFIKFLRVEGGYGPPMGTILELSPNVSDLFLSFEIYATDNTDGLCRGLPLINPTRLILSDVERQHLVNKMSSQLTDALVATIPKWNRLLIFHCPYVGAYVGGSGRAGKILRVLRASRRLHTLFIPRDGVKWAWLELKECPLRTVYVLKKRMHYDYNLIPNDPALTSLLKFRDAVPEPAAKIDTLDLASSLSSSFLPMQSASKEVYEFVCARILYFAMSVPELADDPSEKGISPRLPLLLVSKMFYRLGLPHYYTHTVLRKTTALSKFATALSTQPSVATHVRTLESVAEPIWDERKCALAMARISLSSSTLLVAAFSRMTALVRATCRRDSFHRHTWDSNLIETSLPWDAFCALAKAVGSILQEFAIRVEARQAASVTPLNALFSLTVLDWNCTTEFTDLESADPDSLSSLQELRITASSASFISALRSMKLNSLRRVALTETVTLPGPLLKTHGHKLTELDMTYLALRKLETGIFELCPNLVSIRIFHIHSRDKPPRADDFYAPQDVPSLTKIHFNLTSKKEHIAGWEEFITDIDQDFFPNLREIQFTDCEWPTNERDIEKSFWVRWAEMLLKRNIKLTDEAGKHWQPRLKN